MLTGAVAAADEEDVLQVALLHSLDHLACKYVAVQRMGLEIVSTSVKAWVAPSPPRLIGRTLIGSEANAGLHAGGARVGSLCSAKFVCAVQGQLT